MTRSIRVGVNKFDRNAGQFYGGGDNTATTMSFDAGQDDDKQIAATLGVNAYHEGVGGRKGQWHQQIGGCCLSDCLSDTDTVYYKLN